MFRGTTPSSDSAAVTPVRLNEIGKPQGRQQLVVFRPLVSPDALSPV
jgi:hypothetical protein